MFETVTVSLSAHVPSSALLLYQVLPLGIGKSLFVNAAFRRWLLLSTLSPLWLFGVFHSLALLMWDRELDLLV